MSCEELREQYELYALGLAEQPERNEIHAHLERRCTECAAGVQRALDLVAALTASVPSAAPPARLRRRVLAAAGVPERHYGWPVFWAAAALLCLSAAVYFSGREHQYADESLRLGRQLGDWTAEIRRLQDASAILSAPGTTEIAFGQAQPARPAGRVFINPTSGVLLVASHLPPAPAGGTYEMWIVPKRGLPCPAGRFQSLSDDTATHIWSGPVAVAATAAISVTLQNETAGAQPPAESLIVAALPAPGR
ncbi:MAG: anti-sigma factor domain-containing protein [Bryobacteraceae bacterium]